MPAWLMLVLIVLISVALFADHRRNAAHKLSEHGGPEAVRAPASKPLPRANARHPRTGGRLERASRSHILRIARDRPLRRG